VTSASETAWRELVALTTRAEHFSKTPGGARAMLAVSAPTGTAARLTGAAIIKHLTG
jgi:hypothetical protein